MRKINTGLVGYGMSARVFHAPFLHTNPNFAITKVVERHAEESKNDYPYIKVVRDISSLLSDEQIELIIITTPNATHFDYVRQALNANKHVIVEKPFTNTSAEADQLIELAKSKNRILSVFQNRRWDGDFLTVLNILNSEYLGTLVEYESHFDRFRNYFKNAWREQSLPGSGILYDLGPHLIDHALMLFGLPDSISADVRIQREGGKVDDQFELILNYENLKVTLEAGMLAREPGPRFRLLGTKGSFVKFGLDPQEEDSNQRKPPSDPDWGMDKPENWGHLNTELHGLHFDGKIETLRGCYQKYFENIYDVIVGDAELAVKPQQARDVIRIIELAFESSKLKRAIPFQG